jgi:hypothetical protein
MKKNTFRVITLLLVALTLVGMAFVAVPARAATSGASPPQAVAVTLTPEMLIGFVSVILAVLFDWLPGLRPWYDKFDNGQKRGLMAGLLVIVTGAVFGLSCAGWLQTGWLCNGTGIQDAIFLLILAVAINQGIHSLTKP